MSTIHWLGCGLSSAPGIRLLAQSVAQSGSASAGKSGTTLTLWNRTLAKAEALIDTNTPGLAAREFNLEALAADLAAGDILVSMLPASLHVTLARLAIDRGAHFVCSSYVSPEMQVLHAAAVSRGICLVNEVGLDPGLDHLMAHSLIHDYREWGGHESDCRLSFRSYCGGFPKIPNSFRYKFSWSPLGVLKALASPARSISEGHEVTVEQPWKAISDYRVPLGNSSEGGEASEVFEAYPNRDSLPFIEQYGLDSDWQLQEFVRGTLRLEGWAEAWDSLFIEIEAVDGAASEARLTTLSDALWQQHQYQPGEPDRVVLCVELESRRDGATVWHRAGVIDASGNSAGSAMARLVSLPVAIAVQSVAARDITPGVSTAPANIEVVRDWFRRLAQLGEPVRWQDRLPGSSGAR